MTPGTPRNPGPWVFVDDVDAPALSPDDRHHIGRVLRTRVGDPIVVSDGAGRWRAVVLARDGALELAGDVSAVDRPTPPITICFALTKGERPEVAVQKLTELGVDRIVPFAAARSVAQWTGARAAAHVERLRRVAREAAMQCRRAWLPEVADAATFDEVRALPGAVLADVGGAPPDLARTTVLVGPEGGWSDDERATDLPRMALGDHVLRAETAAMTAAALLAALRSGILKATP